LFNLDQDLEHADWTKKTWDLGVQTLPEYLQLKGLTNAPIAEQKQRIQHLTELPAYRAAPTKLKNQVNELLGIDKGLKPNLNVTPTKGIPSTLEMARAISRLDILPNPDDPTINKIEKYVESPWTVEPTPAIDPNEWDNARLETINLKDLYATDPFLSRKKVRKHIEAMGQALTPARSYAMILTRNSKPLIIDGHHRLMAIWLLGLDKAPVWIVKE